MAADSESLAIRRQQQRGGQVDPCHCNSRREELRVALYAQSRLGAGDLTQCQRLAGVRGLGVGPELPARPFAGGSVIAGVPLKLSARA